MARLVFFISFLVLLASCSSQGLNRGELKTMLGVKQPVVTDEAISDVLKKKPNLPKPFKLGVYFKEPVPNFRSSSQWRWTPRDKSLITSVETQLKDMGVVSSVFQVLPATIQGDDLKAIRLGAARNGADAVLIVSGAADVDRYMNKLGWTYVALITALFVPGMEKDVLFMTSASLWDVRNEYLYLTTEAESEANHTYVAAFGDEDKVLLAEVKTQALERLREAIVRTAKGLQ